MKNDPFTAFLKTHRDKTFFLAVPEGNSGDALLRKGLEIYLKENGHVVTGDIDNVDIILIHGGGNIDDVWHGGKNLFIRLARSYPNKKIVVAPNTCHFKETNFEKVLNNCIQEVHFFTREKKSFNRLKQMRLNKNIHIYLSHDTAFLLEGTPYLNAIEKRCKDGYTLFAFRTDKESAVLPVAYSPHKKGVLNKIKYAYLMWCIRKFLRKELGGAYSGRKIVDDVSFRDFDTFISVISRASKIYTDRLHVGIMGALLKKEVHLFKTKYDKIDGVYEQTLCHYPNVVKEF